jgi:lipid A 3-O-deacylase
MSLGTRRDRPGKLPSTVPHRRPEADTILPRLTSLFALFGFLAAVASWSGAARATEPDQLAFAVGYFDIFDEDKAAQIRAEYRFDEASKLWIFTPFVGFSATNEGGTYGYGGIGVDIFFGKRLVVTPNFAAGIYGNGDGKDLGHAIEFRSGVEIAYRFDDYSRLGLSFHYISNAGLDQRNPGVEILALTYSVPFGALFGE